MLWLARCISILFSLTAVLTKQNNYLEDIALISENEESLRVLIWAL